MPLSDDALREVERRLADGIRAVHRERSDETTRGPVCTWCVVPWPCRQAEYAAGLRRRHTAGTDEGGLENGSSV